MVQKQLEEAHSVKREPPKVLLSQELDLSEQPLLQALADREQNNRDGKMTTIIFIRDKNSKGEEISGCVRTPGRCLHPNYMRLWLLHS
jgi:hypothetical protein